MAVMAAPQPSVKIRHNFLCRLTLPCSAGPHRSDCYEYFGPDYELDVKHSNMENLNSRQYLEKNKTQVLSNLERTRPAPSVQMTAVVGKSTEHQEEQDAMLDDQEADTMGLDQPHTQRQRELRVERPGELFDSEDEDMAAQIGVPSSGKKCRRNERNFKEVNASVSGAAVTSGLAGYAGENEEEFAALAREDNEDVEMDAQVEHHPENAMADGG